ncbi:aminoacetone oxidase family FAD-binding enzyme [Beduini massiliensis]|uniref:aminoacetone oxidase family FAD-binding enzyme n=1 Tax=Beduini massiliensis TaxID=1585974 RepID=UPI00059A9BA3|nr:aminoacetone oxidase family FAD-binding enzyme [Beduini massiliensis]
MTRQIMIIGGGSCGLVCGAVLGKLIDNNGLDAQVTILEKKEKPGKKLLATGNGRCNLSNRDLSMKHYEGHDLSNLEALILNFDIQAFFEEFGLWSKYLGDLLYPQSEQAVSVCECLLRALNKYHVKIICECTVQSMAKKKEGYHLYTNQQEFICDDVVLTMGGDAASQFGSDGSGFKLLSMLGHHIYPTVPSLVQLVCKNMDKRLKGVRIHGTFTMYANQVEVHKEKGEILFTDYGLSGISILQLSRYYQQYSDQKIEIGIDAADQYDTSLLKEKLKLQLQQNGGLQLNGIIHQKYANYLENGRIKEYSYKDLNTIVQLLKDYRFEIIGTKGKENAQVCIGGADVSEFNNETFESKLSAHLYAGGEILDVAGDCGGYNLHFAFACGNAIAKAIYQSLLMEV